jgi:hypothetical protein
MAHEERPARGASSGQPDQPRQDPVIEALRRDAGGTADATMVPGFPAPSSQPGHQRLFVSLTRDKFLDIRNEDIILSQPLDPAQSLFPVPGAVAMFVRSGAVMTLTQTRSLQALDRWLDGDVTRGYLPQAAAQTMAGGVGTPGSPGPVARAWWHSVLWCTSRYVCITVRCGTGIFC